jgi:ABC-2 type transport system ATP-binding protein
MIALGTPRELIATLGGEQVIEFALNKDDETLEPATLLALPGVKAVRTVPANDNAWALTVDEVHVAIPALLGELRGKPMTRLSTHHATLEDVFVSLTGRQLRE